MNIKENEPSNPNDGPICWDVRYAEVTLIQIKERHWYDARNKAARILGEIDPMRLRVTPAANEEWHAYP
jgi:hypothetical protein